MDMENISLLEDTNMKENGVKEKNQGLEFWIFAQETDILETLKVIHFMGKV